MPHCTKCGAGVADNAGFCPSCGAPQPSAPAASPAPGTSPVPASAVTDAGLQENVAGLLCYLLGWITGLDLPPDRQASVRAIPCEAVDRRFRRAEHHPFRGRYDLRRQHPRGRLGNGLGRVAAVSAHKSSYVRALDRPYDQGVPGPKIPRSWGGRRGRVHLRQVLKDSG